LLDGTDSRLEQASALGHSEAGHEQEIAVQLHLLFTHGTAPTRDISGVAPRCRLRVLHAFIDQVFQSGAPVSVDRQDARKPMFTHAVVPENQPYALRGRDTEPLQLLAVRRELQQSGDLGMAGQLGVVDLIGTAGVSDDEVRVSEEPPVEECGLVDRGCPALEGGGGELDHRGRIR